MKENKSAENVLGTLGAVFWTIQILPQIWKSHRTKSTRGLSASLMFLWAFAALFLGTYIVVQRLSIPLQVQPQIFGVLGAMSWCQCLYYEHGYSKAKAISILVGFCVIFAGFEAGSVYALWAGEDNGTEAPVLFYGYTSSVLLAVALLPQYWEIYRLKEVVGISLSFMAIDILGGVFSFLSLFFRPKLDIAAFVSYALVVILDGVVVVLAWILNPIAKKRRAREAAEAEQGVVGESGPSPAVDMTNLEKRRPNATPPLDLSRAESGGRVGGAIGAFDTEEVMREEQRLAAQRSHQQ